MAQEVKNPVCNAGDKGDPGSIPGLGRSSGERNGNPLQFSCLENLKRQKSPAGYTSKGYKEMDRPEHAHMHRGERVQGQGKADPEVCNTSEKTRTGGRIKRVEITPQVIIFLKIYFTAVKTAVPQHTHTHTHTHKERERMSFFFPFSWGLLYWEKKLNAY